MAKGIVLPIASDTRAAAQGLKSGLIEPLEDARTTLGKVSAAGDKATTELEHGFRDAQRATEKYGADYKNLTRTISAESKKQSTAVSSNAAHAADSAGETLKEVKAESLANISETVSSFNGDMSSAIGAIQGTLGGLVPALGPIGIAIGAAGAIGFGLIQKSIEDADAQSEKFRTAVSEMTSELIDAGKDGSVSVDYIVQKLKDLASEADPANDSLIKLRRTARDAGSDYRDLAQAYAGNSKGLNELLQHTKQAIDGNMQAAASANMHTDAGLEQYRTSMKQASALGAYAAKLQEAKNKIDKAKESEQAWKEAGGPDMERKAQDAADYADSISGALAEAGADWEKFATKEGGVNLKKYEADLQQKVTAIKNYQANLSIASGQMSQDAREYLVSLGTDAAPLLNEFVHAPLNQRDKIAADWDMLGKVARGQFVNGLGKLPDVPAPKVGRPRIPAPDSSALDAWLNRSRDLRITARVYDRAGRPIT